MNDVSLGSTPADVALRWGPPERTRTTRSGELEETRDDAASRYDLSGLAELSFGSRATVLYNNVDLLHDTAALSTLLAGDPGPLELHGFLVFFELGVALTGVHDQDRSQLAATIFKRGRWDKFREKMRPWSPAPQS